ncbi:MAG: ankyrin repeat domain-containing protein [Saprospiraceae bacterium]|nr:ankyrin repeat domain-containing protein [Saprospiraceae bacterium]
MMHLNKAYFTLLIFSILAVHSNTISAQLDFLDEEVIIENVHSRKALCTQHSSQDPSSMNNQENIAQYSYTGDPTHKWMVTALGDGFYKIENVYSKKTLCTQHWSNDPKSNNNQENIHQYQYTGDLTQKWQFVDIGNGQYSIENAHSRKVLCTQHWSQDPKSLDDYENIHQYQYTGDLTHKWTIRPVNPPSATTLDAAIKNQDMVKTQSIINKGIKPTLQQLRWALQQKNYDLARLIMNDGGVQPADEDIATAVDNNDMTAITMIMEKGVMGNVKALNKTITDQKKDFFNLLIPGIQPDGTSLTAAQKANDLDAFNAILGKGVQCTNDHFDLAVDQDNLVVAQLTLDNGADANKALDYTISKDKNAYIDMCLQKGADANKVISYSIEKSDINLGRTLIVSYQADANQMLEEAFDNNKIDFATLALAEGGADPNQHLKKQADENNLEFTNLLLDNGGDANLAMDGAIEHTQVQLLQRLISMGADAKPKKYLESATEKRSLEMVTLLVEAGADPNLGMKTAIANDDYNIINILLSRGANPKGHLNAPACNGKLKTVQLLLQYNGDANEGMKCATEKNYADITRVLLDAGADAKGYLSIPSKKGYLKIVTHLVEFGATPQNGLEPSVDGNKFEVAKYLISKGARPNGLVKKAAKFANANMVKLLCENGDAPFPGMSPTMETGSVEIARILVRHGADPKPFDYIRKAVANNHADLVEYLIEQGAEVNKKTGSGVTLLHIACKIVGSQKIVQALVSAGADVNVFEPNMGNTPLHLAAYAKDLKRDNLAAVKILVNAGADVNAINSKGQGQSVLKYARSNSVKKYLKDNGAYASTKKAKEAGGTQSPH